MLHLHFSASSVARALETSPTECGRIVLRLRRRASQLVGIPQEQGFFPFSVWGVWASVVFSLKFLRAGYQIIIYAADLDEWMMEGPRTSEPDTPDPCIVCSQFTQG